MKHIIFLVLSLLWVNELLAQKIRSYDLDMQAKHAKIKGYDTLFRVNYFENIIVKTTFSSDIREIEYINGTTGNRISLIPISEYKIGASFDYKWIALSASFTPKFLMNSEFNEAAQNSSSLGLSINFFYSDRMRQELSYNQFKGFYTEIERTNEGVKNNMALKDTQYDSFEGSTYFIVNRNFSFRAHYAQTERQLKSAGSIIPRLKYGLSSTDIIFNNDEFINEIDELKNFYVVGQLGYLHTFVYNKKWFATIGVHPGIGYSKTELKYYKRPETNAPFNSLAFTLDGELALGYNDYRWFFGTSLNFRNSNYTNNQNDEFNNLSDYFTLYLGYRFNDNKPMRKFFGWFEDTFGF
ncbi:DUF4421 family protein [Algibacter mikhailovii]|uniref:DUF4421 family protein n=1 Tax=Algibacter mikhailovii TaxID=425498 RepID=UPI002493DD5C|nr:DUF4421 family protein [Algibacter mikhailovii]